jgi:fused signal recognition particle receptor
MSVPPLISWFEHPFIFGLTLILIVGLFGAWGFLRFKKRPLSSKRLLRNVGLGTPLRPTLDHGNLLDWHNVLVQHFQLPDFVNKMSPALKIQLESSGGTLSRKQFASFLRHHAPISTLNSLDGLSEEEGPWMIFCLGVNGAGKTTTLAKLIAQAKTVSGLTFDQMGVIGTDTFRAAAMDQLKSRLATIPVEVVAPQDAGKPSTALFRGLEAFASKKLVLVDTSGRLHTDPNLMTELRVLIEKGKEWLGARDRSCKVKSFLICDATHGQTLSRQLDQFGKQIQIDGIIWTKWDCNQHPGLIYALTYLSGLPVVGIGTGEKDTHFTLSALDDWLSTWTHA